MDYSTVLIATDGSKCSMNAVKSGIDLAKVLSANVILLHVMDMHSIIESIAVKSGHTSSIKNVEAIIEEKADEVLNETLIQYRYDKITKLTMEGIPKDVINSIAQEHKVDLIIMGTHGRTGLKRLLMGSVAEHVLRYSKIPVMIVSSHL
jgi:nucleotide-binding universal stress UspA family protein